MVIAEDTLDDSELQILDAGQRFSNALWPFWSFWYTTCVNPTRQSGLRIKKAKQGRLVEFIDIK